MPTDQFDAGNFPIKVASSQVCQVGNYIPVPRPFPQHLKKQRNKQKSQGPEVNSENHLQFLGVALHSRTPTDEEVDLGRRDCCGVASQLSLLRGFQANGSHRLTS